MVLESDEGKGKTGALAEEELEGNVEGGSRNLKRGSTSGVDTGKSGDISNEACKTHGMTGLARELAPDVEPLTVVLVDPLTTDGELHVAEEDIADPIEPTEALVRRNGNRGESNMKVDLVDEITVTTENAGNLATEIGCTIELLGNALHGEIGVSPKDKFPVGDLRIGC